MSSYEIEVPIIADAEREARALGHTYVGNEHVLIALAAQDGEARLSLIKRGLSADALRATALEILGPVPIGKTDAESMRLSQRTQISVGAALDHAHRSRVSKQPTRAPSTTAATAYSHNDLLRAVLRAEETSRSVVSEMLTRNGTSTEALLEDLRGADA